MLRKLFNWLHSSSKKPRRLLIAFTVFSVMEVIKITRRGNVELFFSSGMHLIQGESSGWKRVWHGGLKPLSQTYTTQIWFLKNLFIYLKEREREGEREERNIDAQELYQSVVLTHPQLGTWPATQPYALTGNWTGDLSVCRQMFNSLSHTSQGNTPKLFEKALSVYMYHCHYNISKLLVSGSLSDQPLFKSNCK